MSTKQNPIDIKPVDSTFSNLKEEILGIESSISDAKQNIQNTSAAIIDINNQIVQINTDIDGISLNTDTVSEVVNARVGYVDLKSKLDYIESLDMFKQGLNLTTERVYEYNVKGFVTKEIVSGDMDYTIEYDYDVKDNITAERHYVSGSLVGTRTYEYDAEDNIKRIISDNSDVVDLVTSRGVTRLLEERILAIENINVASELDSIKSTILAGPYDGATLLNKINDISIRTQTVEDALAGSTGVIIDIPNIIQRITDLEAELFQGKRRKIFTITNGVTDYTLDYVTSIGKLKVFVDGIYLISGVTEDYILLDDNKTVRFLVNLLEGSEIICEYY